MLLIDDYEVKFGRFPNGETNLNFNKFCAYSSSVITLKYESDTDLFNLFILKQYLDVALQCNRLSLFILYMPYSRMDRYNDTYTFNLKYVSSFINSLKFSKVYVLEPHSDVSTALLDNVDVCTVVSDLYRKFIDENPIQYKNSVVMFPDAGAEKRYGKYFSLPTVIGTKSRNFETGAIESFDVHGVDVAGKDVVIIDDLCSKGGTFVGAAMALKLRGARFVYLIVAHCENTIFEGDVFNHIAKVYTTNSILTEHSNAHYQFTETKQLNVTKLYKVKTRD